MPAGGGTLDVKDVLSTTNTVEASGSGSIVTLEGNVTNTGASAVLLATAGGELDVKASTITDNTRRPVSAHSSYPNVRNAHGEILLQPSRQRS